MRGKNEKGFKDSRGQVESNPPNTPLLKGREGGLLNPQTLESSTPYPNKKKKSFGATEVAEIVGISLRQLYYWERFGVISPSFKKCGNREFRRYSENDIEILKKIKRFLKKGFMLEKAFEKANNNNGDMGTK